MAELIEFPSNLHHHQALPGPEEDYRAYASPADEAYPSLALLFPDGSVRSYRFRDIEQMDFSPADLSTDGCDVLNLCLAWRPATALTVVRIEGMNLLDLFYVVSQHLTRWLRVLPAGQRIANPTAPVITRIILPGVEA
jgi:hypothetical protein